MWLSRQQKKAGQEGPIDTGQVTLSDGGVAVELDSERRGLVVYAPGGYRWRPAVGQKVLVLKTGEGHCVMGTPVDGEIPAGEVELSAPGGAQIILKTDGRALLSRDVEVGGKLTVAGEELEEKIRRISAELITNMMG